MGDRLGGHQLAFPAAERFQGRTTETVFQEDLTDRKKDRNEASL